MKLLSDAEINEIAKELVLEWTRTTKEKPSSDAQILALLLDKLQKEDISIVDYFSIIADRMSLLLETLTELEKEKP